MDKNKIKLENKICPKCGEKSVTKKIVCEKGRWVLKEECQNPSCKNI